MKPYLSLTVLAVSMGASASAQQPPVFEGTMHATMHMSGSTVPVTYQLKGHRARIDMEIPPTATTILVDSETGQQTVLVPQLKAYLTHKAPLTSAVLAHPPVLTDLHTSETIAGHVCENYQLDSEKYAGTTCLAKDLPSAAFGGGLGMLGNSPALETLRAAGMPLRVDLHTKADTGSNGRAGENVTMAITSIDAHPVEDTVFEIPDGWKAMQNPFNIR